MNSPLHAIIQDDLRATGAIPFSRFMDLALYHPQWGYYEQPPRQTGRHGDFLTSVSVGSLFGDLIAEFFIQGLDSGLLPHPTLIECGAHDGSLARDILTRLKDSGFPRLSETQYWILEPSPTRKAWQQTTLAPLAILTRWAKSWEELPQPCQSGWSGLCLSNELLDSLPVHRLGWDSQQHHWFEWGVSCHNQKFAWSRIPGPFHFHHESPSARFLQNLPPTLTDLLPDGFTTELNSLAEQWWRRAAHSIHRGCLLTFDYGAEAADLLRPEKKDGSLRGFLRHKQVRNPLDQPGTLDLTAPVNFTALRETGEAAGLRTLEFTSQNRFLTAIAARSISRGRPVSLDLPERKRQFHTLTHPDCLGSAFRVLLQSREHHPDSSS